MWAIRLYSVPTDPFRRPDVADLEVGDGRLGQVEGPRVPLFGGPGSLEIHEGVRHVQKISANKS